MQGETRFKQRVLKDLEKIPECYCLKTQERSRRGVPDILLCLKGDFIAIELKVDGERPTKLQDVVLSRIREAGGLAFSTTPSQWAGHLDVLRSHKV